MRFAAAAALLCALATGCSFGGGGADTVAGHSEVTPERLARAVTAEALERHLRELQAIADRNGGTRDTGGPGYEASVEYVAAVLRGAGYEPELQRFDVAVSRESRPPVLERVAPDPASFRAGDDFLTLEYSASGAATARVRPVEIGGVTSGCEASDFEELEPGEIALMRRGECFFFVKARNAERAGASAALVFNDGGPGRKAAISATLVEPGIGIPVLGLSHELGEGLARQASARLTLHVETAVENAQRSAANVIADLPGRGDGPVVLLGAHLDSVGNGPGINDNGSGVAAVLEAAVQLQRLEARPERGLRFAFWAAEELGLHGSRTYVERLGGDAADEIALVLNFDMLASPNFSRLVYDAEPEIEEAFRHWFQERGLATDEVSLEGRSDHAPFADAGIPTGGLFAGADEPKGSDEARLFGGEAHEPHDPCYHQACDTLANVDRRALAQMADAAAAVGLLLARP